MLGIFIIYLFIYFCHVNHLYLKEKSRGNKENKILNKVILVNHERKVTVI